MSTQQRPGWCGPEEAGVGEGAHSSWPVLLGAAWESPYGKTRGFPGLMLSLAFFFLVIMDKYQEQPHLLDPHLGKNRS